MSVASNAAKRDALREQSVLKRLAGRIGIGLEHELEVVWPLRRDDGDPFVLADREFELLLEAEHVGVELQ